MLHIVTICTGNICRSPLAAALLADRLAARGVDAVVTSCGTRATGLPVPAHSHLVATELETSVDGHRARQVVTDVLRTDGADLVLCMDRTHLREVVALDIAVWRRTFTLKELARRAGRSAPIPGEDLARWLGRLSADRRPSDMMRDDPADDLADPYGGNLSQYRTMATQVHAAVDTLVRVAPWPSS